MIEQTIGNTDSLEELPRKLPSQLVVCLVIAPESVVIGFNGNGLEKSHQRFEQTVDKTGGVLESTKQFIN